MLKNSDIAVKLPMTRCGFENATLSHWFLLMLWNAKKSWCICVCVMYSHGCWCNQHCPNNIYNIRRGNDRVERIPFSTGNMEASPPPYLDLPNRHVCGAAPNAYTSIRFSNTSLHLLCFFNQCQLTKKPKPVWKTFQMFKFDWIPVLWLV